jgi:Fur family ferric uptake transcriptional regulator
MAERMRTIGSASLDVVRDELRARGMRWTPQRRALLEVLRDRDGHVTGAELVELCRAKDPETTPSTVYRTLDVLEEIGIIRHSHGPDGREEFHVSPEAVHGHAVCASCGEILELDGADVRTLDSRLRARGFHVDLSHLSVGGLCEGCAVAATGLASELN